MQPVLRVLFVFLLLSLEYVHAQSNHVVNYTTELGLPSQVVNDIYQTRSGRIWAATQSGFCFFNGAKFIPFTKGGIEKVDGVTVFEDSKNRIWFSTNGNGCFLLDNSRLQKFDDQNGLPHNSVRQVYEDSRKQIWILTSGGAVLYSETQKKLVANPFKIGELKSGVLSMVQTADGTYYFGTQGKGVVAYRNGSKRVYNSKNSVLQDDYIFSIGHSNNTVYIGTTERGLYRLEKGNLSPVFTEYLDQSFISRTLAIGGRIYVFSSAGLLLTDSQRTELLGEEEGLISNDLYNGIIDEQGNIWVATGLGISCIRSERITVLTAENHGLLSNKISAIGGFNDHILVGTYGSGITELDATGQVVYQWDFDEFLGSAITSVQYKPSANEVWVGLEQAEYPLLVYDAETRRLKSQLGTIGDKDLLTVTKIQHDGNRTLVSSFSGGLFYTDDADFKSLKKVTGLPTRQVISFEKWKNQWLVSINGKGISALVDQRVTPFNFPGSQDFRYISCMAHDQYGTLYLGDEMEGLVILQGDKALRLNKQDGLLSDNISALFVAGNYLWIGTNAGLHAIKIVKDYPKHPRIFTIDATSGLNRVDIQNNALFGDKNLLYAGTTGGLAALEMSTLFTNRKLPKVALGGIDLFFESVDWLEKGGTNIDSWNIPKSINLNYKTNHLTFKFLSYSASSQRFQYMLQGLDDNWSPISDQKEVTFPNIPPGNYVFKVRAIDNQGNYSEVHETEIVIRPPYWQTWWFRILAAGLVVLAVFGFIKRREKSLRDQKMILESEVKERTKEAVEASERAEIQRQLVETKNKEIIDSIQYAQRIQEAMLPSDKIVEALFPNLRVLYLPKDIVAGDFYWMQEDDQYKRIAIADCTGHGVPGALMSLVCINALDRATREFQEIQPANILDRAKEIIVEEIATDENIKDGMDISLLVIDKQQNTFQWAGANNPLWIIRGEELIEIKGDKQPIGAHVTNVPFTNHTVEINKGDLLVFPTDGYADQFGGEDGKKLKTANFKRLLTTLVDKSLDEIHTELEHHFIAWRGSFEQLDDVCVGILLID